MTAKQDLLDPYLSRATAHGGSELLLVAGTPPRAYVRGHAIPVPGAGTIDNSALDAILEDVFGASRWAAFSIDAAREVRSELTTRLSHEGETFLATVQADKNFRLFASFRNITGVVETDGPTVEQLMRKRS